MRVLLLGHQKWACLVLEALMNSKHIVVGVITETDKFDERESGHYARLQKFNLHCSLKKVAEKYGLKVYQPKDINSLEFREKIKLLNPDILISISYHQIIKKELIDDYTILNAHGSLLPKYRGRAPINWAIINNEKETGVTVHYLTEGLDEGDIIEQEKVDIAEDENALDILKKTLPLYPKLVLKSLDNLEKNKATRIVQDHSKATYFPRRKPKDGIIDWNKQSKEIYNLIRALTHPYPGAYTYYNGKKVSIWDAKLDNIEKCLEKPGTVLKKNKEKRGVYIKTGDGCILIMKIQEEENKESNAYSYFEVGTEIDKKVEK